MAISPLTGSTCPTTCSTASDEIVLPGVSINVADNMWEFGTTALAAASRRRRDAPVGREHRRLVC